MRQAEAALRLFFFSPSESTAWLSPSRETSAANPNFPNGGDGGVASADAAPSGAAANGTLPDRISG